MSFARLLPDSSYVNGSLAVDQSWWRSLDTNTTAAVDGNGGGSYTLSGALIVAGAGMWFAGATQLTAAASVSIPNGSTAAFTLSDSDYPLLAPGHPQASRTLGNPCTLAFSDRPMNTNGGTCEPSANAQPIRVPLIRVHHGATLTSAALHFTVQWPHGVSGGVGGTLPQFLPKFRVVRIDANGNVTPLTSTGAGADSSGFVSPAPANAVAWYNGGNSQTFTITCDQNNVIDRGAYTYLLEIVDESGTNAWPPGNYANANAYANAVLSFTTISDMRWG